jgi:pyrroloquinoline quinone (PQQ) biosynthesis protein C
MSEEYDMGGETSRDRGAQPSGTLASQAVLDQLTALVHQRLTDSPFWAAFTSGAVSMDEVRSVFSQYYLWRNAFHRWFGVCIVKSPAFGTPAPTDFILRELAEHIEEEVTGDHHGMCRRFMAAIGVPDVASIEPLQVTLEYAEHFPRRYLTPEEPGERALAALAARELVAPERNRMTIDAFSRHYGITEGLEFFELHEELENEHFRGLWNAVVQAAPVEVDSLLQAARDEIVRHVAFWDDVAAACRVRSAAVPAGV